MRPSGWTFSRRSTCRFFMARVLSIDEGQEAHVPRALDGLLEHPLALRGQARAPAREHLPLAAHALAEELDVLVIEVLVLRPDALRRRGVEALAAVTAIESHGSDLLLGQLADVGGGFGLGHLRLFLVFLDG